MNVYGTEVSEEAISEAVARAASAGGFLFSDLVFELARLGVGGKMPVADRCADRVLQRMRKRGEAKFEGGYWHLIGDERQ